MLRLTWLCTIALLVQVNTSLAQTPQSGTITVGGDADKWYPVTFVDDGWNYEIVSTLDITRFSIHTDALWKGSMVAQIKFHSVLWGHSSGFIDVDLKNYRQTPSIAYPTGDFIAGWQEGSWGDDSKRIIIWLKGGNTTYTYRSNVTVSPVVYLDPSTLTAYGGPYSFKMAVEPYVNIYGRNEQTAFYNLDHPNYFRGRVGIGTTNPQVPLEVSYSDNAFGVGFNISNQSSGNTSLSGYSVSNSSNGRKGQLVYVPGNYANTDMQNTFQMSSVGDTRLGFVAAADDAGTPDIYFQSGGSRPHAMHIVGSTGHVGIGTNTPGNYALAVNGDFKARRIKVTQSDWPDYVFEPDYKLAGLDTLELYIRQHRHLPGIVSAAEVENDGIDVGDNQAALLKKVEELTLYIIELKKEQQSMSNLYKKKLSDMYNKIRVINNNIFKKRSVYNKR